MLTYFFKRFTSDNIFIYFKVYQLIQLLNKKGFKKIEPDMLVRRDS